MHEKVLDRLERKIQKLTRLRDIVADPELREELVDLIRDESAAPGPQPESIRTPRRSRETSTDTGAPQQIGLAEAVAEAVQRRTGRFTHTDIYEELKAQGFPFTAKFPGNFVSANLRRFVKSGRYGLKIVDVGPGRVKIYERNESSMSSKHLFGDKLAAILEGDSGK